MTSQMKDALKGQGGGLQNISQSVGETVAGESDMRGYKQRKSDAASSSLGDMANPSKGAQTTEGTSISGGDQATNMNSGSADHLDLAFRKS
ncbi:hypothetical protein LTR85_011954 [Meristemomyces frigidus]|nr:hypothetical protein LTR85_011954 [Meristemomyces frigidus]